jgi:hypothetical protein
MQNESFTTFLSEDQRISQISETRPVEVLLGPNSSVFNVFTPTTTTNSLLDWNVSIPSQSICVDRHVMISSTVNLQIDISNVKTNDYPFVYGFSNSFSPYPLNNLFLNSSITVNNSAINSSTQNIISPLLRINESADLQRYSSMTPSMPDSSYLNYRDGIGSNNNPLAGFANASYDSRLTPRGAFPFKSLQVIQSYNDIVATYTNIDGNVNQSYFVAGVDTPIPADYNCLMCQSDTATFKVLISSEFTEPILGCNPLTFSNLDGDKASMVGLNQINLSFNVDTQCRRVFRNSCGNSSVIYKVKLQDTAFTTPKLFCTFISPSMVSLFPKRNALPMTSYQYQITNSSNFGVFTPGQRKDIRSGVFQLSQLPSKFIIVVRKQMNDMTSTDSDSFFSINTVSINMSTQNGILSNMNQQALFMMSAKNGYSGSYYDFSGQANYSSLSTSGKVATTGSVLVINPSLDLSLGSPQITNNSIGQFSFQINMSVTNNYSEDVMSEICIICANSGIITSSLGESTFSTGLLTESIVMNTLSKGSKISPDLNPMQGSGFESSVSGGTLSGGSLKAPVKKGNIKKYI